MEKMNEVNKQRTATNTDHHPSTNQKSDVQCVDLVCGLDHTSSAPYSLSSDTNGSSTKNSVSESLSVTEQGEHPYKADHDNFKADLSACIEIEPVKNLDETPLIMIETKTQLEDLINNLQAEKALGVDLEYSDHGYVPLTCTIQISTKSVDYIVDTIKLKDDTALLLPIFLNPNIVKVFHASSNDLKWLQQDFKMFVVNLFDTQIARKYLGEEKLALKAALLQKFNVQQDKSFQRVDFRIRPLPEQYKEYARRDSHYLIGLYEIYRNDLMQLGLLEKFLDECIACSKVLYGKDDPCSGVEEYVKGFHQRQLDVLKKLNEWRHAVAKQCDKAPGVVLSKEALKKLTLQLPQDQGLVLIVAKSQFVKKDISKIMKIMALAQYSKNSSGQVQPNIEATKKRQFNNRGYDNWRGQGRPNKRGRYEPRYDNFPTNFYNFNNHPYHNNCYYPS